MARDNSTKPPSYRLHKATGQAVITVNRKDHYLGKHGSPESRLRYERLITTWMQSGTVPERTPDLSTDFTVAELCAQYLRWAATYYVKDGKPTTELKNVKRAIKALREAYANLPAKDFSPLKLKVVRQRIVDDGLSRVTCNRHTTIITRIFAWATENELVPAEVWHALQSVKALFKG